MVFRQNSKTSILSCRESTSLQSFQSDGPKLTVSLLIFASILAAMKRPSFRKKSTENHLPGWQAHSYLGKGMVEMTRENIEKAAEKCTTPHFYEDELKAIFVNAFNSLLTDRDSIFAVYEEIIADLTDNISGCYCFSFFRCIQAPSLRQRP